MVDILSNSANKEILIFFEGDVSDGSLDQLLNLSEKKLNMIEKNLRVKKKVFKIVVEMVQNIYHYYTKFAVKGNENILSMFKFTLDKENDVYTIQTGNHINSKNVPTLKKKIDKLNSMNSSDLRSAYIKQLSEGKINRYGGAGLGMIDIAKSAENKLCYAFKPVNESDTFFSLWTTVSE